jgi:hypothetical protein
MAWRHGHEVRLSFLKLETRRLLATFTVTDGLGGMGQASVRITAGQVALTAAISGAATAAEGSAYRLDLAAAGTPAESVRGWSIDWGDGTPAQQVAGNPAYVLHAYEDGFAGATATITARVYSDSGVSAMATHNLAVANVAPTALFVASGPSSRAPRRPSASTARPTSRLPTPPQDSRIVMISIMTARSTSSRATPRRSSRPRSRRAGRSRGRSAGGSPIGTAGSPR